MKTQIENFSSEREFFLFWLLKAIETLDRMGWEEGFSHDELADAFGDITTNYGVQGDTKEGKQLINKGNQLLTVSPIRYFDKGRNFTEQN